jgi:DNA-binding MarR family transcriptional regulator
MSIENDINQITPFKTPYHRLLVNLMYTSNWMVNAQLRMLKPHDLSVQQYNVLRILRGQHPDPVKVISITERMLDKMSNASRLVDKLVEKKLAERTESPTDRRAVDVAITEAGLALLEMVGDPLDALEQQQRGSLTQEEVIYFSQLLDRLRA